MSPLLEVKSVSKSYGARKVTDDLSFSLAEGETLGVLGPNGAGKSTMFDLITGDVRPDAGHVHYCSETSPNCRPRSVARRGSAAPTDERGQPKYLEYDFVLEPIVNIA